MTNDNAVALLRLMMMIIVKRRNNKEERVAVFARFWQQMPLGTRIFSPILTAYHHLIRTCISIIESITKHVCFLSPRSFFLPISTQRVVLLSIILIDKQFYAEDLLSLRVSLLVCAAMSTSNPINEQVDQVMFAIEREYFSPMDLISSAKCNRISTYLAYEHIFSVLNVTFDRWQQLLRYDTQQETWAVCVPLSISVSERRKTIRFAR